jgi:formamidopyrimidine-DNA glycosylase
MPELPEVEVLVRHLAPLLAGQSIRRVQVRRAKVLASTPVATLERTLVGAKFAGVSRRGKYLVFSLRKPKERRAVTLLGHLGMTGRMYVDGHDQRLPKHAAIVLDLGRRRLVYEDMRYFGRFTLDASPLARLGPEPLGADFTADCLGRALRRSGQSVKVKLLDQSLVAGIGNIYASEALFRARISPFLTARQLLPAQVRRLWRAIRAVLRDAVARGSTVPLHFGGRERRDGLFYFGRAPDAPGDYAERLRVYDREGQPCYRCGASVRRCLQAARSTFYCPRCQARGKCS